MQDHPECAENLIHYDEADCDGGCLAEDCLIAIETIDFVRSNPTTE